MPSNLRVQLGLLQRCITICIGTIVPIVVMFILLFVYHVPNPDDRTALYSSLNVTNILIPSSIASTLALIVAGDALKAQELEVAIAVTSKPDLSALTSFFNLIGRFRLWGRSKEGTRRRIPEMVLLPGWVLALVLFFGWGVFVCDNWIHSISTSVPLTSISSQSFSYDDLAAKNYTFGLASNIPFTGWGEYEFYGNRTAVNVSSSLIVFDPINPLNSTELNINVGVVGVSTYLNASAAPSAIPYMRRVYSKDNIYFVGPFPPSEDVSISAHSIGVSTECENIAPSCQYQLTTGWIAGGIKSFHCPSRPYFSDAFSTLNSWGTLNIPNYLQLLPFDTSSGEVLWWGSGQNPLEYGVFASTIGYAPYPNSTVILWCKTSTFLLNYTMTRTQNDFEFTTSNLTLNSNSSEAWLVNGIIGATALQNATLVTLLQPLIYNFNISNESSADPWPIFALEYSRILAAFITNVNRPLSLDSQ